MRSSFQRLSQIHRPECVQEALDLLRRLLLQDFDAAFHLKERKSCLKHRDTASPVHSMDSKLSTYIYFGGLVKGTVRVHVVIKNDDAHHHPHAEQERVLAAEATGVFPENTNRPDKMRKRPKQNGKN